MKFHSQQNSAYNFQKVLSKQQQKENNNKVE